jgi:hypothetical protein
VFDLDHQLRLVDRGGGLVSLKEYREWRSLGNAYIWDTGEEKRTGNNPTLLSSIVTRTAASQRTSNRGYWGDVVTGPFLPFGIELGKKVVSHNLRFLQRISSVPVRLRQHDPCQQICLILTGTIEFFWSITTTLVYVGTSYCTYTSFGR